MAGDTIAQQKYLLSAVLYFLRFCYFVSDGPRTVLISFFFVLDNNELKHIEQTVVKHCHSAVATCILECVKQNADRSTIW